MRTLTIMCLASFLASCVITDAGIPDPTCTGDGYARRSYAGTCSVPEVADIPDGCHSDLGPGYIKVVVWENLDTGELGSWYSDGVSCGWVTCHDVPTSIPVSTCWD